MDAIRKIEAALDAGPTDDREWELWTSNSWRRIQGVIEPTIQHHDNHPDLHATIATLEYVVAVQPKNIREVLQTLASKEAELAAREAEIAGLREALIQVADWRLPPTGEVWPTGAPVSFEANNGSVGVMNYFCAMARAALTKQQPTE